MTQQRTRISANAMTLLEAVLAMTIISIIAGILTPMLVAASDHYAAAANTRQSFEQSASAMDRIVRLLRETPLDDANPNHLGFQTAQPTAFQFEDGAGVHRSGDLLIMTDSSGLQGTLSDGVEEFEILYIDADGITQLATDPHLAHTYRIRLRARGVELRTVVFPRVRITGA